MKETGGKADPRVVNERVREKLPERRLDSGDRVAERLYCEAPCVSAEFDMVVIGSGPAGQKAAIQAAKLRRKVALVERRAVGGACVNTGTIPSKTIREAVLYLTGLNQRAIYGQGYRLKDEISVPDIALRVRGVVERERSIIRDQLLRNHVALLEGTARFVDAHTVAVADRNGGERRVTAESVVIATGSEPARPPQIQFDGRSVLDSDDIVLRLERIPNTIVIVGAGVIGIEFASMFAALGARHGRRRASRDARLLRPRGHRGAALPPARAERRVPLRRARDRGELGETAR